MKPEPSVELERLIERARALAGDERHTFLRTHCADSSIRQEVELALAETTAPTGDVHSELGQPTVASVLPAEPDAASQVLNTLTFDSGSVPAGTASGPVPTRIGKYDIVRLIGKGGMGAVYLARQERPARKVALKLIRPDVASPQVLRRFELEAEVLGRLHHPGIAQIYEAGTHQSEFGPQPFFAMELVEGMRLTMFVATNKLNLRQKLELFAQICDAVQHAHQKGVVHRDLKPGNILVTRDGQPKVLDFGVARATDCDMQMTMQTDAGQLLGTLPYMSPEQVSAKAGDVDTRSDVYALGVVLYQLLSGKLPYKVIENSVYEAVRVIQEHEPMRLRSLNTTLRGDVDTIVAKALEKTKERRYQTASALAADIRRYLNHEPIVARPASALYQLGKFSRRNRGLVGGVMAAFVVLIAGVAVSTTLAFRESTQRRAAERAQADLEEVVDFQAKMLSRIQPREMGAAVLTDLRRRVEAGERERGASEEQVRLQLAAFDETLRHVNATDAARAILDTNILAPAVEAIATKFVDQPVVEARMRHAISSTYRSQGLYEKAFPQIERAIELRLEHLGPEHADTLRARGQLAMLYWDRGSFSECQIILEALIPVWEQSFGPEYEDTLTAKMCLGVLYMSVRRNREACTMLRKVVAIRERVLGPEHKETIDTVENLAVAYTNLNIYDEATSLFERSLAVRRRDLGDDDKLTIGTKRRLADVYHKLGRRDEAVQLNVEAVDALRTGYGERYPATLAAMASLSDLYKEQSRYAEAEPLAARVLALRRELLGENHPSTIDSIDELAVIIDLSGRHEDAGPLFEEALERSRVVFGDDAPATMDQVTNLGINYWYQGRLDLAEPMFVEAVRYSERRFGEDHTETAAAMDNLAVLYTRQGRLEESGQLLRKAIANYRAAKGEDSLRTLKARAGLASLAFTKGDFDEAERIYIDVFERQQRALGPDHQSSLETAYNFALTYRRLNRDDDAAGILVDLIERRRRLLGAGHRETLDAIWELAAIHVSADRMTDARPLIEEVIALRREAALAEDANPANLHACAVTLLDCPISGLADTSEALSFARKANELTYFKDAEMLNTLARGYDANGDHQRAVDTQSKAIDQLPPNAPKREEYEAAREDYRKALMHNDTPTG